MPPSLNTPNPAAGRDNSRLGQPSAGRPSTGPPILRSPQSPPDPGRSRAAAVLTLLAKTIRQQKFAEAVLAVANELAVILDCDRVSIGFRKRGRTQVHGVSHSGWVAQRQNLIRLIADAMDESIDQKAILVHPLPAVNSPLSTLAHRELARFAKGHSVVTVPIVVQGEPIGAITASRRTAVDQHVLESMKDAATFCGPVLELLRQRERSVTYGLSSRLKSPKAARARRVRGVKVAGALIGFLLLLAFLLWPVQFRVIAPATVEGIDQQIIAAPSDGFIESVRVRPGDSVRRDDLLAVLDGRDLAMQRAGRMAEVEQLDKDYRNAMSGGDAAKIVIARSKLQQARAQLNLIDTALARTELRAPIDGVVLAGDLSQAIGKPVSRGDELMSMAPAQRFRIMIEVDEADIHLVSNGQQGQVLFTDGSSRSTTFSVRRIAPVAMATDGKNIFAVQAAVDADSGDLRYGMPGVAKIDVDERRRLSVWSYRLRQNWRKVLWRLTG